MLLEFITIVKMYFIQIVIIPLSILTEMNIKRYLKLLALCKTFQSNVMQFVRFGGN